MRNFFLLIVMLFANFNSYGQPTTVDEYNFLVQELKSNNELIQLQEGYKLENIYLDNSFKYDTKMSFYVREDENIAAILISIIDKNSSTSRHLICPIRNETLLKELEFSISEIKDRDMMINLAYTTSNFLKQIANDLSLIPDGYKDFKKDNSTTIEQYNYLKSYNRETDRINENYRRENWGRKQINNFKFFFDFIYLKDFHNIIAMNIEINNLITNEKIIFCNPVNNNFLLEKYRVNFNTVSSELLSELTFAISKVLIGSINEMGMNTIRNK